MSEIITIRDFEDTYITQSKNYNTADRLKAEMENNRLTALTYIKPIFTLPQGKKIIKAILKTYVKSASDNSAPNTNFIRDLELYTLDKNWNNNTINWSNKPSFSEKIGLFSIWSLNISLPIEYDITETFKKYNGFGFGLKEITDISGYVQVYLYSTRATDVAKRPVIEITTEDYQAIQPNYLTPNSGTRHFNESITLDWVYEPAYNGDVQSKYDLQYSVDGGSTWIIVTETTSNTFYTLPANTFNHTKNIKWKVRVYNPQGLVSEYSQIAEFIIAGIPQTPTITTQKILITPSSIITWQQSNEQVSYNLKLSDTNNIEVYNSNEIVGIESTHDTNISLENNKEYTIKLAIKNQYGIWSDEATKIITTVFPEPAQPDIKLTSNNMCGTILITCIKKSGVLETHHFEVYRKDEIHGDYIKIADDIDDTYTDYSIKSGKTYYYKIRAVAEGGQYKDSTEANKAAFVKGSQLALTSDYSNGINLRYNRTLQVKYQLNRQTTNFDGREKPVAEYGEHLSKYFSISFLVRDNEDIQKIEEILTASETILYRDDRGRRIYGTVTQLNLNDDRKLKYNLTFTLQEVDFSEVV